MMEPQKPYQYSGVIHIHTTDSDGTKTHKEIIAIAQKYGIDFLMFADHMTIEHKNIEDRYGKTIVIVGYEHNDKQNYNHYVIFGIDKPLSEDMPPKDYVHRVRQVGGLGIIAHPDEKRSFPDYPPLPWTEWSAHEFDGIEIWNHMSAWLEGIASGNKLKYLLNPRSMLISPPQDTLERWDRLALKRRVVGIASADAHGHKKRIWGPFWRTIFPYHIEMCSLRTHILTKKPLSDNFAEARTQIFNALRSCRVFTSNYRWGDASEFRFWAETGKAIAIIGDRIIINSKLKFFVHSPLEGQIRLIRNGEVFDQHTGKEAEFSAPRLGVYRAEVWRNGKGWIFSNHIKVVPPEQIFPHRKEFDRDKRKIVERKIVRMPKNVKRGKVPR